MADPRLPDVVPLSAPVGKPDSYQPTTKLVNDRSPVPSEWHKSPVFHSMNRAPVVQIWASNDEEVNEDAEPSTVRRCSTLSEAGCNDSGIDSQLPSPIPGAETTDQGLPDNFLNAGSCASHLAVPKLLTAGCSLSQRRLQLANSPVSWRVTVEDEDNSELVAKPESQAPLRSEPAEVAPVSLRPRTLQRSLAQAESGLTAWRIRSESLQKMRLSVTDETVNPHICINSPTENRQQRLSLDEARQNSTKEITVNRLSLDEKFIRRQKRVSVDECSIATVTQQSSVSNISQGSSSSLQLPDFTKSASDCYSSSEEEPTFSRHPSFCSVRSDCGAVGGYLDESSRRQLGRLLSRSSSRPSFLSVPPRLANISWPQFAQSQPSSRRQSTLSQLGSLTSIPSRISLSKSLSSTASPYCRLDSQDPERQISEDLSGQDLFVTNALSLTQRLAFPQLASPKESGKNRLHRDGQIETESNLNFFAKIITFLVLVFAIVLFVGVLIKLYHPPQ